MKEKWKIRIANYGTFDFEGTEDEAEEMRVHKSDWEGGIGLKWRVENQTEKDKLTEDKAIRWDVVETEMEEEYRNNGT